MLEALEFGGPGGSDAPGGRRPLVWRLEVLGGWRPLEVKGSWRSEALEFGGPGGRMPLEVGGLCRLEALGGWRP